MRRDAALDGLRALAAFVVFLYHLSRRSPRFLDSPLHVVVGHFNVGIHIFFVLSGLLVYGPFARALRDHRPAPALLPYAIKRVARIWPAYLVVLVPAAILGPARLDGISGVAKHATLTYLYFRDRGGDGITVTWTLVVEWGFYVLIPIAAAAAGLLRGRHRSLAIAGLLVGVGAAAQWHVAHDLSTAPWIRILPPCLLTLGIGMVLAAIAPEASAPRPNPGWIGRVATRPGRVLAVALAAFVTAVVLVPAGPDIASRRGERFLHEVLFAIVAAALVTAVLLSRPDSRCRRLLGSRPIAYLGTISYGFYLWHVPVLRWLRPLVVSDTAWVTALGGLLALGLSLVAAALSWTCIERPALGVAARLAPKRRTDGPTSLVS